MNGSHPTRVIEYFSLIYGNDFEYELKRMRLKRRIVKALWRSGYLCLLVKWYNLYGDWTHGMNTYFMHTSLSHQIINSRCFIVDKGQYHRTRALGSIAVQKFSDEFQNISKSNQLWAISIFPSETFNQRTSIPVPVERAHYHYRCIHPNEFDVIENVQFHKRNRHFVYTFSRFIAHQIAFHIQVCVCLCVYVYNIDRSMPKHTHLNFVSSRFGERVSKLMNYGKRWGIFDWLIKKSLV